MPKVEEKIDIHFLDEQQFIENIEDGEEWNILKSIMKSMARHSLEGEKNV